MASRLVPILSDDLERGAYRQSRLYCSVRYNAIISALVQQRVDAARSRREAFRPSKEGPRTIAACPQRFKQVPFLEHVAEYSWPGPPPSNPQRIREVTAKGLGNADFVVVDMAARI